MLLIHGRSFKEIDSESSFKTNVLYLSIYFRHETNFHISLIIRLICGLVYNNFWKQRRGLKAVVCHFNINKTDYM